MGQAVEATNEKGRKLRNKIKINHLIPPLCLPLYDPRLIMLAALFLVGLWKARICDCPLPWYLSEVLPEQVSGLQYSSLVVFRSFECTNAWVAGLAGVTCHLQTSTED